MISLLDIHKTYHSDHSHTIALNGVSLSIEQGQFVAIVGASGSGKSTLMNIIGLLEQADEGSYSLFGRDTRKMDSDRLAFIRNRYIGFVFQFFNLIPRLNAIQNVELPLAYSGMPLEMRQERARLALQLVGLGDRLFHLPSKLSGGQQQRVAIARAITTDPSIIIADEPTGSLDPVSSHDIMNLFRMLNEGGKTIIVVTHAQEVAAYASRLIEINRGLVAADYWTQGSG